MAISQSQSSKKILADFPPSSRVDGISFCAAARATFLPTSVDPVNASFLKPLCSSIYCPDLEPEPVSTLNTPAGSTSWISLASSSTLNGVALEDLNTVQQPLASTGASFQAAMRNGKFQGTICPTTPIGSLRIRLKVLSPSILALPSSAMMQPAK